MESLLMMPELGICGRRNPGKSSRNAFCASRYPFSSVMAGVFPCIGEDEKSCCIREVAEETGVKAKIVKYIGKSDYSFNVPEDVVEKEVHWYLMKSGSYYSRPQREEFFCDSGYYKYHEAYHLLKFDNERYILERGYNMYKRMKREHKWE